MSRRLSQPADLSALSSCAPDLAQAFVSLASDIALVVDTRGTVLNVVQHPSAPIDEAAQDWVGRPWVETVTEDTRRKIERLLEDVASTGLGRRREVNHGGGDASVPVAYTALRLGQVGPVLAVGRDLRSISAIQQRFLSTQQEIERGYWQLRRNEARQRLLLHAATDAFMAVDGRELCILEGNRAAQELLCKGAGPLEGRRVEQQFEAHSRPALRELMARARAEAQAQEGSVRLAGSHITVRLQVLALGHGADERLLLRARAAEVPMRETVPLDLALIRLIESMREGIVITDLEGRTLAANRAFARLVHETEEDRLIGQWLDEWLQADATALALRVQELGIVQGRRLMLRRANGPPLEVELTGMLMIESGQRSVGYIISSLEEPASESGLALPKR